MSRWTVVLAALGSAAALATAGCRGPDRDPGRAGPGDAPSSATAAAEAVGTTSTVAVDAAACTSTTAPITLAYDETPGIGPDLQSLDVYGLPEGCPDAPVVFWVHGGAWSAGDKANEGTATKAAWAASHGWVLVAANYRLSTPGSGVVWPTHGQDVAAAVGYTLDRAPELGIDPAHVALMGHSAGGHLVSIVSVDPALLAEVGHDRSEVDCLVSLDTEGYDLVERAGATADPIVEMVANAFGTDPEELAAASPLQTLERVGGPVPDALIVTRGLPRRRAQARRFAEALRSAGGEVTVVTAGGYGHGDVSQLLGTAGETVETPAITSFLGACLA